MGKTNAWAFSGKAAVVPGKEKKPKPKKSKLCPHCGLDYVPRHKQRLCDTCKDKRDAPRLKAAMNCGGCGIEFTPAYSHQNRCEDCIKEDHAIRLKMDGSLYNWVMTKGGARYIQTVLKQLRKMDQA